MVAPTRFSSGVGTRTAPDPLAMFTHPDPTDMHRFFDDFDTYTSGQWTATITGTGAAALTAGDGGLLALTTSATSADNVFLQKTTEGFSFEVGRQAWFKTRLKVDALTSVIAIGLQVTDTTPLDVTDGIYFLSTTGTGAVTCYVRKNATTGSATGTGIVLVANTFTELAWYWDGRDTLSYFQDGVQKGSITGVAASYLPDTTTTPSLAVQTSSAAIRALVVDYVLAAKARP